MGVDSPCYTAYLLKLRGDTTYLHRSRSKIWRRVRGFPVVRLKSLPASQLHLPTRIIRPAMATISLNIEFGGGLELLFSNQRSHRITIPANVPVSSATGQTPEDSDVPSKPVDITYLMYWLRDNLLKERAELFVENGTVYVLPFKLSDSKET